MFKYFVKFNRYPIYKQLISRFYSQISDASQIPKPLSNEEDLNLPENMTQKAQNLPEIRILEELDLPYNLFGNKVELEPKVLKEILLNS